MNYYTLKENETGELHLFEVRKKQDGKCSSADESICGAMKKNDKYHLCLKEKEMRIKCAEIGRQVCGTCVSHLYENYK